MPDLDIHPRLIPLNRWIAPAQKPFKPDLVAKIDSALRYASFDVYRQVPMLAPPEHQIGKRMPEVLGRELMYQVATGAERAICLDAPVEIRYRMSIQGRLVLSRAKITADASAKVLTFEIARLLGLAMATAVPF